MKDCIFCKIIDGSIPSYKIFENEHTLAFLDISPNNPGHSLVIPKIHSANIYEIGEDSLAQTMYTVKKLTGAIKKAVEADGINVSMNNDTAAGQIIFHSHVHIIPRFSAETLKNKEKVAYSAGEAQRIADRIKASLD